MISHITKCFHSKDNNILVKKLSFNFVGIQVDFIRAILMYLIVSSTLPAMSIVYNLSLCCLTKQY